MQVEQQLRTVLSPTYLSSDKEKALQEQQVGSPWSHLLTTLHKCALKQQVDFYCIFCSIPTEDHHQDMYSAIELTYFRAPTFRGHVGG